MNHEEKRSRTRIKEVLSTMNEEELRRKEERKRKTRTKISAANLRRQKNVLAVYSTLLKLSSLFSIVFSEGLKEFFCCVSVATSHAPGFLWS